jgi:hypothetical protein
VSSRLGSGSRAACRLVEEDSAGGGGEILGPYRRDSKLHRARQGSQHQLWAHLATLGLHRRV